ncbi:MAG: AAA family ATPase [Planctomycetes bacterium]|nr:AAA family ATPase [Planctomycetota bacterium]
MDLGQHQRMVDCLADWLGGAERIETHISSLLLVDEFVYKLKKPLDLGFLDFRTLDRRHLACQDELRLNRRTAPKLYLSVEEVRGTIDDARFGGAGPILDYAVKMRRFAEGDRLDHLLSAGRMTGEMVDELADSVVHFHDHAARADRPDSPSEAIEPVLAPMRANFVELRACADVLGSRERLERLEDWTERSANTLHTHIIERQARGSVRECHGDLHLANIALVDGRVTPFDCIEFDAELRWIDVMSDLAFLTMDFEDRGASRWAHRVLDRYMEIGGDLAGLHLVRFYQVYRALVRAKIAAIRWRQSDADQEACQREFESYMDLADRMLLVPPARVILMHGVSCSGKSHVSQQLVEHLGAIRLRSDRERKRLFPGSTDLYDECKTQATYDHLLRCSEGILRAGFPVIVDATFLNADQRQPFAQLAASKSIPMTIVHTQAHPSILHERMARRATDKGNISDATAAVLQNQLDQLAPLHDNEPILHWDTSEPGRIEDLIAALPS